MAGIKVRHLPKCREEESVAGVHVSTGKQVAESKSRKVEVWGRRWQGGFVRFGGRVRRRAS
ncbi:MAG: hypothetical protein M1453_14530, partial [Acidobacteria bacterium]|nr:hypothetical protein [Acidobacteriota bacterium]